MLISIEGSGRVANSLMYENMIANIDTKPIITPIAVRITEMSMFLNMDLSARTSEMSLTATSIRTRPISPKPKPTQGTMDSNMSTEPILPKVLAWARAVGQN